MPAVGASASGGRRCPLGAQARPKRSARPVPPIKPGRCAHSDHAILGRRVSVSACHLHGLETHLEVSNKTLITVDESLDLPFREAEFEQHR